MADCVSVHTMTDCVSVHAMADCVSVHTMTDCVSVHAMADCVSRVCTCELRSITHLSCSLLLGLALYCRGCYWGCW